MSEMLALSADKTGSGVSLFSVGAVFFMALTPLDVPYTAIQNAGNDGIAAGPRAGL
jgi:hypothetical protein